MLLISDLHLTDNEADKYRWKIWEGVADYYDGPGKKNLIILGDLTDSKDHHSARLVNAIVERITDMTELGMEVFILKGNHDYIDPDNPFFEFLGQLEYVNYIKDPSAWLIQGLQCLFLPHTRDPRGDWSENNTVWRLKKKADLVFMHQSVIGSVTSNNYKMTEGLPASYFKRFKGRVISGDIHVPQECGPVTYVGAPYSVRFNDHYEPRAIEISPAMVPGHDIMYSSVRFNIPGRRTLDIMSVDEIEAPTGFQIKVRVHLDSVEQWPTYKEEVEAECKKQGLILSSLHLIKEGKLPLRKKKVEAAVKDPSLIVQHFGKRRGLTPASIRTGRKILKED